MLPEYKRKSLIAASLLLAGLLGMLGLDYVFPPVGNIWETRDVPKILAYLVALCAYWYGVWVYAKGKGYSGILGVLLGLLLIFGLAVLAFLPDRRRKVQLKSPGAV